MSLKNETRGSLNRYFDISAKNGLYYEPLKNLAIESNSYALGSVNTIAKNINFGNGTVKFSGGKEEDFSNKKTPPLKLNYNLFLEILDLYSDDTDRLEKLFNFINQINEEKITSKTILNDNLFVLISRKIFSVLNKDFSEYSEKLIEKEREVRRNIVRSKEAMLLYEQSFEIFKEIYSIFLKYVEFSKSDKYIKNNSIESKKTAFKIFLENSMTSKEKLFKLAKEKVAELKPEPVKETKSFDIFSIDLSSEESVSPDYDGKEALVRLEPLKSQDQYKMYFIYDNEIFKDKFDPEKIRNEIVLIDAREYLARNDDFNQFLNLLEILKSENIRIYADVNNMYFLNSLNENLSKYVAIITEGKIESIYEEPQNTSYLNSLNFFTLPKNINIFEKINEKTNIENYINPLYFNILYIDTPIMDEISLDFLKRLENKEDLILKEREAYIRENKQKIIDDEIAVFYSSYDFESLKYQFIEKTRLRNSRAYPIMEGEFFSIAGPKSENLLFRDNRLVIDGKYINHSDKKEFYSIAFVSLAEVDNNDRAESAWAELMESNDLRRAIFNISSKNLKNIFKTLNGYNEGLFFNKTKLEHNKKALSLAKIFKIEPEKMDLIQPTIIVSADDKVEKMEITDSSQLLVRSNPEVKKKTIYFLYNDWTEDTRTVYVEEEYIGDTDEFNVVRYVEKENKKNLYQFLNQVTIFEHIDSYIKQVKICEIDYYVNKDLNGIEKNYLIEKIAEFNSNVDLKIIEYIYNDGLFLIDFQDYLNKVAIKKYAEGEFPFYNYDGIKDLFYTYLNNKWNEKIEDIKDNYKKQNELLKNYKNKLDNFGVTEERKKIIEEQIKNTEDIIKYILFQYNRMTNVETINLKQEIIFLELIFEEYNNLKKKMLETNKSLEDFIEYDRKERFVFFGGINE